MHVAVAIPDTDETHAAHDAALAAGNNALNHTNGNLSKGIDRNNNATYKINQLYSYTISNVLYSKHMDIDETSII